MTPCMQCVALYGALSMVGKITNGFLNACFEVDETVVRKWLKKLYLNGDVKKVSNEESRDEMKQRELWENNLKLDSDQ